MSTPINQLPQQVSPVPPPKVEEDPLVSSVIQEMENEFRKESPPAVQAPPMVQHASVQMQQHTYQHVPVATTIQAKASSSNELIFGFVDVSIAKKAVIVSVLALAVFYKDDLTELYSKFSILQKVSEYDKFARALILLALVYIFLWKFSENL